MTRSMQKILHQLTLGLYPITKPLVFDSEEVILIKGKYKKKKRYDKKKQRRRNKR